MSLEVCSCLIRGLPMFIFSQSSYGRLRSYYLLLVLLACLVLLIGFQILSQCYYSYLFLIYVCVIYSSLFTYSSFAFMSLCCSLFRISSIILPLSYYHWVQVYILKIAMFISSYILSLELAKGVHNGLNVSYLTYLY